MLLSNRCTVFTGDGGPEAGFVARSWDFPFAMAAGAPGADVVRRAAAPGEEGHPADSYPEWHLLAPVESLNAVAAALPGWRRRGVTLHRWTGSGDSLAALVGERDVRLAPEGWVAAGFPLDGLPEDLRLELATEHARTRPLAAAFAGGRLAATCYAPFETEGLWDVAVDTLPEHRRRGLAAACFARLAAWQLERRRRPVWGALDDNEPSMRLAARLGFEPVAKLTSFVRPAE